MRRATCRLAAPPWPPSAAPRVLVLTTSLDSGGVATALRVLGYRPYTFADVYKHGHIRHHPHAWLAVLDGATPFDAAAFADHAAAHTRHPASCDDGVLHACIATTAAALATAVAAASTHSYDAFVGPPATTAFPAVLRSAAAAATSSSSLSQTRVVLIEEVDKARALREAAALARQLREATCRMRYVTGHALHMLVWRMTSLSYTLQSCQRALAPDTHREGAQADAASLHATALAPEAAVSLLQQFEELVKATVPADRLLVYHRGDGWEPLVRFLQRHDDDKTRATTTTTTTRRRASGVAATADDGTASPSPRGERRRGREGAVIVTDATGNVYVDTPPAATAAANAATAAAAAALASVTTTTTTTTAPSAVAVAVDVSALPFPSHDGAVDELRQLTGRVREMWWVSVACACAAAVLLVVMVRNIVGQPFAEFVNRFRHALGDVLPSPRARVGAAAHGDSCGDDEQQEQPQSSSTSSSLHTLHAMLVMTKRVFVDQQQRDSVCLSGNMRSATTANACCDDVLAVSAAVSLSSSLSCHTVTSASNNTDNTSSSSNEDSDNPFAYLRPVLRSEEDDIRKGVFSKALRNLSTCSLAEKQQWCRAILDATPPGKRHGGNRSATAASAAQTTALASANVNADRNDNNGSSSGCSGAGSSGGGGDGGSRTATDACVCASPAGVTAADTSCTAMPRKRERVAAHDDDDVSSSSSSSALDMSWCAEDATAAEYIAAFMRAQLDRVVGGSLNNLSAHALRVLCLMLRIPTSARSKDTLYNILASFYYTHCEKLGKRVSRSSYVTSQAHHEAQMLQRLLPKSNSHTTPTPTTTTAATTTSNNNNDDNTIAMSSQRRAASTTAAAAAAAASKTTATRTRRDEAAPLQSSAATQQPQLQRTRHEKRASQSTTQPHAGDAAGMHTADELEVALPARVFAPRRGSAAGGTRDDNLTSSSSRSLSLRHDTATSSHGSHADEAAAVSWTGAMLERQVASIVHLYDPVTVAMVVKKLAQVGYRDTDAMATVEAILRRFHDRQQIFYDNGIAYLM